ncbi:MAG: hypothetical protein COA78_35350 [Blastopirellula sp.]|nr:MAG: hypothetical protein COA78_35350 [Blastopirellula sp.]
MKTHLLFPVCFVFSLFFAAQISAAKLPNIIFFMADDMGMGDTSAYQQFTGNSDADQVHTPNMERLAKMGVLFTDAHTPSTRCTSTRYGLLTGRYPWRSRMKHWVLFGSQGDPLIERDRPTIATLLKDNGYRTAMFGKWHVGLRYRNSDGNPAAGFADADLQQPLFDTPLDHGFDVCKFTSRSHGTSGPQPGRKNKPNQNVGPGHVDGRIAIGATSNEKKLVSEGDKAYVLSELGGRHSDHAVEFLDDHLANKATQAKPFFVYYPSNSNHGPYTPDSKIGDKAVSGAAKNVAGQPMNVRGDFVYENDLALGRLIDYLEANDDPRNPGQKLINNTIVIFTSDNGAERNDNISTGPFRSHKGSTYEGGHRVPFIVSWPAGSVGSGTETSAGVVTDQLIGLHDMYATFSEIIGVKLPDVRTGNKGAEDSTSVLAAWRGQKLADRVMFYNDHNEAKDHAAMAMRLDNPNVNGSTIAGNWKILFDASLLRQGKSNPIELYDLKSDSEEKTNLIDEEKLKSLVDYLSKVALLHRNSGGHRLVELATGPRILFDWTGDKEGPLADGTVRFGLAQHFADAETFGANVKVSRKGLPALTMNVKGVQGNKELNEKFQPNAIGLGISGGEYKQVDSGEAILISFSHDVIIESASIVAGNSQCGGFYQVGSHAPLAIYCIDADIDANDQSGKLSDIGILKKGETLRLDSSPHYGSEAAGRWRLADLTVRVLVE